MRAGAEPSSSSSLSQKRLKEGEKLAFCLEHAGQFLKPRRAGETVEMRVKAALTFLAPRSDRYERECLRLFIEDKQLPGLWETLGKSLIDLPVSEIRDTVTGQAAPDKDLREATAETIAPRMKAMPKRTRPKTSLRAAARATTFREKSKTDRSKNRNYPGYRAPGKIGTKLVGADVPSATHAAFQQAALAVKKTMKELLTDFINAKAKNFLAPEVQKECAKQKPARVREKQNAAHKWLGLA